MSAEVDLPKNSIRNLGLLAARPLLPVAIALIVGIACHKVLPHQPLVWLSCFCTLLIAAILLRHAQVIATWSILLSVLFGGISIAQVSHYYFPSNHISQFTSHHQRLCEIELKINNPPRIYAPTFGQAFPLPPRQTMIANVSAIRTWNGWETANGLILVTITDPNPELSVGQTIRTFGMLDRPAHAMNPGQFDWATYYRDQGVLASLHVPHSSNVVITDRKPLTILQRWRDWTRHRLADGFDESMSLDHALLRALVLGDTDPELRDIQEQFRATGTSHHLAISGAHIALMGGLVFLIARLLRLSPRTSCWLAMIFVVCYGLAALPSAPVVRSVLLWLAVLLAVVSRRALNLLQMLALVVILMLVYKPTDLFNAGFQLTFCTVLGLIILTRPIGTMFRGDQKTSEDPHVSRWLLRAAAYIDSQIILIIAAGLAAWLISMPIIAGHFTQLNPWAIFASIILGPVVFLSLTGGVLKIILTAIWPSLAGFWATIAQHPISWMRSILGWLADLPYSDVPMPAPPIWSIIFFYLTLIIASQNWQKPGIRLCARLLHVFALGTLLILPYRTSLAQEQRQDDLRITFLSVGAGQCAIVEPPSHRTMVVDAGSLSLSDPVRKSIAPFLRDRGITSLDSIAISHANSDHFSAVAELVESYGVREVLVAEGFENVSRSNAQGAEMLSILSQLQRPPRSVLPGQSLPLGANTKIEILWPPAGSSDLSANDQSMVFQLTHAGIRILFTGDIQDDAMRKLMRHPDSLKADILIAPHHGSSESSTAAFIEIVNPAAIICSDDRTPSGKQNRFDQLTRGRLVYRTHLDGAITIHIDPDGRFEIESFLNPAKKLRR